MFLVDLPDIPVQQRTVADLHDRWKRYYAYLDSIRARLPDSAFAFATARWHYNSADHRCPHGAWVEALTIREPSAGRRREMRDLEIQVRLLGAYQDGLIELTYLDVHSYALTGTPAAGPEAGGHGDWLFDEVRLAEGGRVLHEIRFASRARWTIQCADIRYAWEPLDGPPAQPVPAGEAYCINCRRNAPIAAPRPVALRNGRRGMAGRCGRCGKPVLRVDSGIAHPEEDV